MMLPNRRTAAAYSKVSVKDAGKTAKRLLSYLTGTYKIRFLFVLICILISAIASVAGSLFLQILIDKYITPMLGSSKPLFTGLIKAIFIMAGIYLVGVASALIYNLIMVTIEQGVQKEIRDQMFSHMQSLPIKYFDTHTHGDIMSRYTNDIDTLRQMISQSIPQVFSSVITIIFVFSAMIYVNIFLTMLVVVMVVGIFFIVRKIGGRSSSYFIKQQSVIGKINGYIEEMMHGQKVVKVFCYEEEAKKHFDMHNKELGETASKANSYANMLMPLMVNMGNLQYVFLAIAGGALAVSGIGGLTLGSIAAFLQLSRSFNMPINQVSQQLNSVIMAMAGAQRIFNLMDEKEEEDSGEITLVNAKYDNNEKTLIETKEKTKIRAWKYLQKDGSKKYIPFTGDVSFVDVDFGYEKDKTVLHNITMHAEPGKKVAFVGATGAGKTTMTNLINRFYDIQKGQILYDGISIDKIKKSDLRRSQGIVLQDTHLFTGTIMENIRYGKLDADDENVYAAAKLANADGFISMLPEKYNTVITGSGEGISQGQRQLLAIARAAVADPLVMILDEATSSIDTRTEMIVQKGMDSLMHGRTVFVIAHRLSTIRNSDVIMVMDGGRIIESGTPGQLLMQKGRYYQLYTGIFELE